MTLITKYVIESVGTVHVNVLLKGHYCEQYIKKGKTVRRDVFIDG